MNTKTSMKRGVIELGVPVECDDGPAGKVGGIAVDVSRRRIAHLIVEPPHRHARAHLVPVDLVAPAARGDWALLLNCTQAELDAQRPAVEVALRPGRDDRAVDPEGWVRVGDTLVHADAAVTPPDHDPGMASPAETAFDLMPEGEAELRTGAAVVDRDYQLVGRLRGFAVDPDWGITGVAAAPHRLPGGAEMTIPISAVAAIEPDIVRLAVARDAVS
jgi:hypothetical protein